MLKLILIIVIATYTLSKIGRLLFRFTPSSRQQYRPNNGKVNVNGTHPRSQKGSEIKGGEYVDYEEVK